jgi:hypothetical protein
LTLGLGLILHNSTSGVLPIAERIFIIFTSLQISFCEILTKE